MSWNYRIIRSRIDGTLSIHEVYYNSGIPVTWTEAPSSPFGETIEELRKDVEAMARALSAPILRETTGVECEGLEEEGL